MTTQSKVRPPLGWFERDGEILCFKFQSGGCGEVDDLREASKSTHAHDAELASLTTKFNALAKEGRALAAKRQKDLHRIDVGGGETMLVWATCKDETFEATAEQKQQRSTPQGLNRVRAILGLEPIK